MKIAFYTISLLIFFACSNTEQLDAQEVYERTSEFDQYWFQSKAEITSYDLEQVRYGELRKGSATLIFVTEPFNTKKNVKSDNGIGKTVQSVLKLNHIRNFNTGIYPYTIMTSSFTPVSQTGYGKTFKTTNMVQEWCGQVFTQLAKKGNQYDVHSYSYFEREGDKRFQIKSTLLEDEIFQLIRINPSILKEGEIHIIPAAHYLTLMHKETKAYKAKISIEEKNLNNVLTRTFIIYIPELNRKVTINSNASFPFEIESWEEEYPALSGKIMRTKATKRERMMIDYWNRNREEDYYLFENLFIKTNGN